MNLFKKGKELFYKYVKQKFIRYIFVGGLNTIFGYGLYCLLIWLGLPFVWATLVSHVLGVLFNFMTTGTLVFDNHEIKKIFKFVINYVLTYFINIGCNKSLQVWADCDAYIAGAGATIFTALVSFFILNRYVYYDKNNVKNEEDKYNDSLL